MKLLTCFMSYTWTFKFIFDPRAFAFLAGRFLSSSLIMRKREGLWGRECPTLKWSADGFQNLFAWKWLWEPLSSGLNQSYSTGLVSLRCYFLLSGSICDYKAEASRFLNETCVLLQNPAFVEPEKGNWIKVWTIKIDYTLANYRISCVQTCLTHPMNNLTWALA